MKRRVRRRLAALMALACLALSGCAGGGQTGDAPTVLLDGAAWGGGAVSPESADPVRVYVTVNGAALIDLPFGEAHTVVVKQPGVGENTVTLTGEAVYMSDADCENHDCVDMGQVTRENLELRPMGGFIVCLPHRLSVEVRGE